MTNDVDLGSRFLRWEQRGATAWVTIDRPERRNALDVEHVLRHPARRRPGRTRRRSLHALVVTGTGDVFAPGGELGGQHDDGDINIGELLGTGAVPFDAIRDSRKPVIAAVNGLCMGGGLLITMLSDVAIASDRAMFGAPELRRGVADAYHAAILPEHVGIALAARHAVHRSAAHRARSRTPRTRRARRAARTTDPDHRRSRARAAATPRRAPGSR